MASSDGQIKKNRFAIAANRDEIKQYIIDWYNFLTILDSVKLRLIEIIDF